jgi:hypothetical protein
VCLANSLLNVHTVYASLTYVYNQMLNLQLTFTNPQSSHSLSTLWLSSQIIGGFSTYRASGKHSYYLLHIWIFESSANNHHLQRLYSFPDFLTLRLCQIFATNKQIDETEPSCIRYCCELSNSTLALTKEDRFLQHETEPVK